MALVSGGRSNLNPNAPLFIPAAVRQVEDFSPEWWNLVTTSTWFRDYWLSQRKEEEEDMYVQQSDDDVVQLLPETIDLGVDEDVLNMEAQFEEFLQSSQVTNNYSETKHFMEPPTENGLILNKIQNKRTPLFQRETAAARNWEKPATTVNKKCISRYIHQPR